MPPPTYQVFSRENDATLNAYDAHVLAVLNRPVGGKEENGYWVMSSPNAEWIPDLRWGSRSVYQCADGRFGYEDRSLWPQYYCTNFEYICCIPRQPEDPDELLSMLWWNPGADDFIPIAGSSVDLPSLGELAPGPRKKLQRWRDDLVAEVKEYQDTHKRNSLLGILETTMRHAWFRLTLVPMSRQQLIENIPEFQRYCLDIRALLDYLVIYYPRLALPQSETNTLPVSHHLMGAVTENDQIVMQLYDMKIPVWHLRNSRQISSQINIEKISYFSTPSEMNLLPYPNNPFPIICNEPPGTTRLQATQRLGCVIYDLKSEISAVEGNANDPPGPSRGGGSNKVFRPAPYPPKAPPALKTPSCGDLLSKSSAKTRQPTPQVSRDTFRDVDAPYMPPIMSAWAKALSVVFRPGKPAGSVRLGYSFPDANLIAGSNANGGRYLVTWLSRRAACIYKHTNMQFALFSPSSQDWRSFLGNTLSVTLNSSALLPPTSQCSTNSNLNKVSAPQRRKQIASKAFADMLMQEAIPETVYWQGQAISTHNIESLQDSIDHRITKEVLWDLFEHNFRFELLALDRLLNPAAWCHPEKHKERDLLLRGVFFDDTGRPGGYYLVQGVPQENSGLVANQWETRRPFVENLSTVMSSWPRPPLFPRCWDVGISPDILEARFLAFEQDIACFYCQTFYNTFGRAANIPHRIQLYSAPSPLG